MKERVKASVERAVKKYKAGVVIMMELPAEQYFETSVASIKMLTKMGFDGVYVSFQRPFRNIDQLMSKQGVNTKGLLFIDVATALSKENQVIDPRCIHISPAIDIDELVRAIYTSIPKLKNKKTFVFIDSLTTISLYKPLSEVMRFSEFLTRIVRKPEAKQVVLIFNVAKDLTQKKFIKDIALHVDEVIRVEK